MAFAIRLISGLLLGAAVAAAVQAQQGNMATGVLKSIYAHADEDCRKDPNFSNRQGACPAYATCVQAQLAASVTQEQAMAAVHDKDIHLKDSLALRRWQTAADLCSQKVTSEFAK